MTVATRPRTTGAHRSGDGTVRRCSIVVDSTPAAARCARRFAETTVDFLDTRVDPHDLALLISEIVANAVHLDSGSVEVSLSPVDHRLRVEVRDHGEGMPEVLDPGADEVSGRGLLIVDRVSDRWGIDQFLPGKIVWFELAEPSAPSTEGSGSGRASAG